MRISDQQRRALVEAVVSHGDLAYAAHVAGMTPSAAKALLLRDEDLAREVDDAQDVHRGLIYATALQRAVTGGSDPLLAKLLEARVDGFSRESRTPANRPGKPSGLRLRTFEQTANGDVVDVKHTDIPVEPVAKPSPDTPPGVLFLDVYKGI